MEGSKSILKKVEELEALIPQMEKAHGEAREQMQRSIKFINFVKKWHPKVFESALNEIDIPDDYCAIGRSTCLCGWTGDHPVSGCPKCNHSFVN